MMCFPSQRLIFRKVQIHVIQCDDKVQSDVVLTCADDLKSYMEHFSDQRIWRNRFQTGFLSM